MDGLRQEELSARPVSVYVSRSADSGRSWNTVLLDVSAHRRDVRPRGARLNIWGRRLPWRQTLRERSMRCGTQARRMAGLSAYIFRLPQRAGQAGRRKRTSRRQMIRLNTVFQRLLPARPATCALPGWTRATLLCGMFSIATRATAGRPGRRRRSSLVRRGVTTMFVRMVSAFPSAITSRLPSIILETRTWYGAKDGISSLPGRSGTRADGSQLQFSLPSSQFSAKSGPHTTT